MTTDPTEHETLGHIFRCLETDSDDLTDAELNASLRDRGLDPEGTTALVAGKVSDFLKCRRLSWQDAAKQKQATLQAMATQAVSWSTRKRDEIEAAFNAAREGNYGTTTQGQLQVAFRNLSNISVEDKASFLDEIDLLQKLKENDSSASGDSK